MKKAYIISACRTPIGKMGGALSTLSASDLGAIVIKEALRRSKIPPNEVDHVFMGCVIQAGLGQNVARQASIKAGLPVTTTAETVNAVCGSGLECINNAARMIQTGDADVVIAGGMESMSNAPYILKKARFGYRMGNAQMIDAMLNDALWDCFNDYHMGITAENICEQWQISRKELDEFSANSHQKAVAAILKGKFKDEIVPVEISSKNNIIVIDSDESPRTDTTANALNNLRAVFKSDGIVTAGNSSGINDGAAATILVSEDILKELKAKPMAQWLGGAMGGCDPSIMGIGPVVSTGKLLDKLDLTMDDIDLIEANEAFAAQSIAVLKELGIPKEKLNVNGGAIALGHPVGASGCRILVTLLYEMIKTNKKIGLATLCIGGGMGCSAIVKRD